MVTANQNNILDSSHNTDTLYWERLKTGDPEALGYFYDRYVETLFSMATRLTDDRDLAQDAIQEVFVDLWQYRGGIGCIVHSLAYLRKALRNKLFRHLQTALQQAGMPEAVRLASPEANGEEILVAADEEIQTRYRLTRALSDLSQRQQQIVALHFYEGLSYEQIAEKLRMNYQSVNNLAYRTMLRLRDNMTLSCPARK